MIYGFDDDVAKEIAALFPTAKRILDPSEVLQSEYDLVISDLSAEGLSDHLYMIGFGFGSYGSFVTNEGGLWRWYHLGFGGTTIATEFIVPESLNEPIRQLVQQRLLPIVQSQQENETLELVQFSQGIAPQGGVGGILTTFLATKEPAILAASFTRSTGADVWCLPKLGLDPLPWIRVALSTWRRRDLMKFPIDLSWESSPEWMTGPEVKIVEALKELEGDRDKFLAEAGARAEQLRIELASTRAAAEQSERRLLTATGDGLVDAVQKALELIGFSVENRDLVNPPNDRLEDLRITCPDEDPDWVAIAEVRGYVKGAAQGDLLRLTGRFAKRFQQENKREPTRLWYVVNQFIGTDPGSRPPVLETNPGELAAFQEEDGMVADTASLFQVLKRIEAGEVKADQVRQELIAATGRWP